MMRSNLTTWVSTAGLVCLAGCYSGVSAESAGADGSGPGISQGGSGASDTEGDSVGATESDSDSDTSADTDDPAELCGGTDLGLTALRRLTASQYEHSIRDLLGLTTGGYTLPFSPDERAGAFKSNGSASVGELQVEQYMDAAEAIAVDATTDLTALLPCDAAQGDTCAEQFLADFGRRAYRRPLEPAELAAILDVYQTGKAEGGGDMQNGLRIAIAGVLQSPFFLYHVEFGLPGSDDEQIPLTGYELASRLSYFLWDSMPDDGLFAAAEAGELDTAGGVRDAVTRMLADPKALDAISLFHQQWVGVDELEFVEKDGTLFPEYNADLAQAMEDDVAAFARYVMTEGDGTLDSLLTGSFTLSEDPQLLALYGVELPPGHVTGEPIPLPANERAGLLTMPGVMASHAHPDQTSPIYRGILVRTEFLCDTIPPPPGDVDNVPPSPEPGSTARERFAQHTEDPACAGCHVLIDPLGFGLESYSSVGVFRTEEEASGLPIDNSGEMVASDVDGTYQGGVELAGLLANSDQVRECVSRQWFRFALGRIETDEDECALEGVSESFTESNYDVRVLLGEIALSNSFRFRRTAG